MRQMYNFCPKKMVRPPGYARNFARMMALFIIILSGAFTTAAHAQQVSLSVKNAPLTQVFDKISTQTGFDFLISTEHLRLARPVTLQVQNETLQKTLDLLFDSQPLTYTLQEKMVVIAKKTPVATPAKYPGTALSVTLTGEVKDSTGATLPGATIQLQGSGIATIADSRGTFRLAGVPDNGVLAVSFVGFRTVLQPYNTEVSSAISIILRATAGTLDEVVLVGYGQTSKRFNTGSVSKVTAADIENQPVTNPLSALQGRAPGVLVQSANGLPGGNVNIQIRGQGSLASGTNPLYILDGVPFLSSPLYGNGIAAGANGAISPFTSLSPDDIESISILKDADATAIYGSRGANGVVLITTKRGKAGRDELTISADQGISQISRLNKYLDLAGYLELRREAFRNDQLTPTADNAPDLLVWDTTRTTDWQHYFYGKTAHRTAVNASLSGGSMGTQYLATLNFQREGSIFPGDISYQKGGGLLNVNHSSADKKFTAAFSANYNRDNNRTLYSFTSNAGSLPPNFPIYNPDGTFNWSIDNNPVAVLGQTQSSRTNYFNFNTQLGYRPLAGLQVKVSAGYNRYALDQVARLPAAAQNQNYSPTDVAYFAGNTSERYLVEPQLHYSRQIGNSQVAVLLGGTYQQVTNEGYSLQGDGVSHPGLLGNIGAANTISAKSNTYVLYRYESLFSRITYQLNRKYLLNFNVRRDGSSRFGPDKRFGNFFAAGAAWIFSEEEWVKRCLPVLSFGKLRGSYGTTGNDQISDYQYLSTYQTVTVYGGIATLSPARAANPAYSWETTKKLEAALEMGLLKDRIFLTAAWYRNRSSNQLIAYTVPYITGFASYQANFPATVQNTGWELELRGQAVRSGTFSWDISANLTIPRNKLVSFPGLSGSSYANALVEGQDLSLVKAFQFTGVDPQTGLPQLADLNGDGQIAFPADVIIAGKTSPDLFGGLNQTLRYGNLELDVLLEYVKRDYPGYTPSLGSSAANDPVFVLKRWRQPGQETSVPRATANNANLGNYYTSQFSDASYLRLKNAALAYTFTGSVLQKMHLKGLRVYLQGQNLFVLANRDRFDPEVTSGAIPPMKTIVAGLKITL